MATVVAATFLPALACGFVNWDDQAYVSENPVVLGGLTPANIHAACTGVFVCNWAPLTMLSYQCDATVFGPGPWGFHLTNVLLHALACGLLFVALVRMTARPAESLAVALLFGVHPLRVESVAWVSERKDVLSVCLMMATLVAYEASCRRRTWGSRAAVWGLFTAGMLAKSSLMTLPLLLLLLDAWPLGRWRCSAGGSGEGTDSAARPEGLVRCLTEKVPLCAIATAVAAVALVTQQSAASSLGEMPLLTVRVPCAVYGYAWYVWKTLVPTGLCPIHRHTHAAPALAALVGSLGFLAAATCGAVWAARRAVPAVWVGLAWYALALLPMSGLVQIGSSMVTERYTYVPHVGLLIAVVFGGAAIGARLGVSRTAGGVAVVIVGCLWAILTVRQIAVWRDSPSLWRQTLAVDPTNGVAMYQYGCFLRAAGQAEAAVTTLRSARDMFPAAKMPPHVLQAYGLALLAADKPQEAVEQFHAALALAPDDAEVLHDGIIVFATAGRLEEAATTAFRLVKLQPSAAQPRSRLGQILLRLGRPAEAVAQLEQAARLATGDARISLALAEAYLAIGERGRAAATARAALASLDETFPESLLNRLHALAAPPPDG